MTFAILEQIRHWQFCTPSVSLMQVKMPQISDRKVALRLMRRDLTLNIALESSGESDYLSDSSTSSLFSGLSVDVIDSTSSDSDCQMFEDSDSETGFDSLPFEGHPNEVHELYFVMQNTRYFIDRPIAVKSNDFIRNYFDLLPPKMFRQMMRMDKNTFFELVQMIENHHIFVNNSTHPQAPIEWQLAVTLDRLGHNGNGACLAHMIPTWGVSNGSINNFTLRVFVALEVALVDYVRWPGAIERHETQLEFAKKGFANCVGLIDGSLLPLAQRPTMNGECYFDRKSNYSINEQVVCDHKRKILFLFTGMPGSCCDITCFRKSPLYRRFHDAAVFSDGQYLLGDSGYMNGTHMVCSFKKCQTDQGREDFNLCVAKCRVTNEHCIGVLKSRWHSLRELRIQLNEKKDSVHMVRWIGICAKLHNFVISKNDIWSDEDQPIILDLDEFPRLERGCPVEGPSVSGSMLPSRVQTETLAWNRLPGGCLHDMVE